MAGGLVQFAGWLATQVFDVVGSVAGPAADADDGAGNVDLQVGKTVFHDVPARMRTELWMSQLQSKSARGARAMGQYRDLLFETLHPDILAEIDKDTHRTFPGHKRLTTAEGQQAMLNVLRAYALSDPDIGYTQGMNFLAGLLLTYLPGEAEAYCALSLLMHQRGLREMYLPDMRLLQIRLWQLGKLLPPRLAEHLESHAVLPVLYASSWLLTCFAADFPFHFAARVMDVLLTGHQVASPVLKIAVAIVTRCERDLLRMADFEEMVTYLRQEVPRWPRQALQDLLTDALSKPWSARQLKVLDEINGAETVMEAVARVNNLVQQPTCAEAEVSAMLEAAGSSASVAAGGGGGESTAAAAPAAKAAEAKPQASPRTVARSLSSSFRGRPPLPPPPSSARADSLVWDAWKDAGLAAVAKQQVLIEKSIGDLVDLESLDPQLSQALSAYQRADGPAAAAGPSFAFARGAPQAPAAAAAAPPPPAAAPPPPAAAPPPPLQQQQQRRGEEEQLSPAASAASPSPIPPEEMQRRWDAFATTSSMQLQAAPSPFGSAAPPPAHIAGAVTFDTAQLAALRQEAAAEGRKAANGAASPAQQQQQPRQQPRPAELQGRADTFGSFQLAEQGSCAPLVLQQPSGSGAQQSPQQPPAQQQQQGSTGSTPQKEKSKTGFLGLFGGRGTPGKASPFSDQPAGEAGAGGDSNLIQEVPSSHGSSLAAVLSQLGLSSARTPSAGGGSHGGSVAGGAASHLGGPALSAGASQRRLHHSNEAELFGSWKTAAGSAGAAPSQDLGSAGSFHSAADWQRQGSASASSDRLSQLGQRAPSSVLSSTASSGVPPPPGRPAGAGGAGAGGPAAQQPDPQRRHSASERAGSLQEEHLAGFLASGKEQASRAAEQASRAADKARLGLPTRPTSAG